MISQKTLIDLFHYDKDSGVFTRKKTTASRAIKGQKVGWTNSTGYLHTKIDNKAISLHRMAWIYVYGKLPKEEIDHINKNRQDNRICNLREVTKKENRQNKNSYKNNTSGYRGVIVKAKKFAAQITANGKTTHLGYFENPQDAHEAYCKEAIKRHTHNEYAKSKQRSYK